MAFPGPPTLSQAPHTPLSPTPTPALQPSPTFPEWASLTSTVQALRPSVLRPQERTTPVLALQAEGKGDRLVKRVPKRMRSSSIWGRSTISFISLSTFDVEDVLVDGEWCEGGGMESDSTSWEIVDHADRRLSSESESGEVDAFIWTSNKNERRGESQDPRLEVLKGWGRGTHALDRR